jgi:succinate dehydrogenase/fumarate reductase flavoprotein subunit
MLGPSLTEAWMSKTFDIVKLWGSWGITMKYNGEWKFSGHAFPGRMRFFLKYKGKNQKEILTRKAQEMGVEILNRTMVVDLLGNSGEVRGALAINTRQDELLQIQAKSVILGTGQVTRLYPFISPAVMNNRNVPINLTGDGRAMAYRLGGEILNPGFLGSHVGLRNFARSGQGSWLGVYRGPDGKPLGHYVSRPDKDYGDVLPEVDKKIFANILESGRGPVYMDCTGITDDHLMFMIEGLVNEGNEAVVNHFKEEGVDLRKNPIEFMTYPNTAGTGQINIDANAASSVQGLFAAGDEYTHSISAASVFGWWGGEHAALYAQKGRSPDADAFTAKTEEKQELIDGIQKRAKGYDWKDANIALQELMVGYAGSVRSEAMLEAGLRHLRRLRVKVDHSLKAANRWELTRCLEVINLYDLGEVVFHAALERKESRGNHRRVDYPYADPLLNGKLQVVTCVNGQPKVLWKKAPHALQGQLGV